MKKYISTAVIALMTLASAQKATFQETMYGNQYELVSCTKVATGVECDFKAINNERDAGISFNANAGLLVSPTGEEAMISGFTVNGVYYGINQGQNIRKGITYNLKIFFNNYSSSNARYFDFLGERLENVSFGAPKKMTTTAPATADRRQIVQVGSKSFLVVMHECYKVGQKASCLVSVLNKDTSGKIMQNATAYPAMLLQFNDLTVTGGKAQFKYGDKVFSLPVR